MNKSAITTILLGLAVGLQHERIYSKYGETCLGFDENTGNPFPKCEEGLECKKTCEVSVSGSCYTCVNQGEEILGKEGYMCEGPNETNTGIPFPVCGEGLEC